MHSKASGRQSVVLADGSGGILALLVFALALTFAFRVLWHVGRSSGTGTGQLGPAPNERNVFTFSYFTAGTSRHSL